MLNPEECREIVPSANLGDQFEPLRARVLAALAAEGMTLP